MSRSAKKISLPKSLESEAQRLADDDGVSLDQWVALAVAQKIGAIESTADFFRRRAAGATGKDLLRFLRNAPDVPPDPGDELPEGFKRAGARPRRRG